MYAALESNCQNMNCVFCPDGRSKQPPPDVILFENSASSFRVTGLEPLNSPRFFEVLDEGLARAPGVPVVIETTGLALLDPSMRARVAAYANLTLLIPLYGSDAATNEAVTRNPDFFAAVQALLATELGPRIRLQTLAVRANIEAIPALLDWCAAQGLTFGSLRVLTMRGSERERELYRDNVVSFTDLVRHYIGRLRHEPAEKFDGCFAALPRCVLQSAGIEDKVAPWANVAGKIALDEANMDCPHHDCALFDVCPKIPDVYRDVHGLDGIRPVEGPRRLRPQHLGAAARRLPTVPAGVGAASKGDGRDPQSGGRTTFGPLHLGANIAQDWRIVRIRADALRPAQVQLRNDDGGEVTLCLAGPGQAGDSGPFNLPGCKVWYDPTGVPFDRFRAAGEEVRRLLQGEEGEVDAARWGRWLEP